MRLVRVGGPAGVELCVDEHGDPGDPLVLLLNGAAASMDSWDVGFCRAIADGGRRVVRYDHRDTGRSTTGTPGAPAYDGNALEQDCADLVEVLGAPAHLVGLSMGGGIAQSLALRRPELVASLTLVATAAAGGVDSSALPGPTADLARWFDDPPPEPDWGDRESVVAWAVAAERVFAGSGFDEGRSRAAAGAMFDRSHDPAAAGNHWLLTGDDEGAPLDVHRIAVPTLVVHGTADPMFPLPHAEALAAAVPGARLLVIDDMGHQVPPKRAWPEVVEALLAVTRGA
jgi:pimeloyl-ACP methyl ester carboxylesterase